MLKVTRIKSELVSFHGIRINLPLEFTLPAVM